MSNLFMFFLVYLYYFFFFFFSSRRRHTRCGRDWSSDVCLPICLWVPFRSLERGWRRGATRSSYRGRDQAGATDVILDIKRLLLSPGNTSILPENIVGQSLSVGFRPLPQTTPIRVTAPVLATWWVWPAF